MKTIKLINIRIHKYEIHAIDQNTDRYNVRVLAFYYNVFYGIFEQLYLR